MAVIAINLASNLAIGPRRAVYVHVGGPARMARILPSAALVPSENLENRSLSK